MSNVIPSETIKRLMLYVYKEMEKEYVLTLSDIQTIGMFTKKLEEKINVVNKDNK